MQRILPLSLLLGLLVFSCTDLDLQPLDRTNPETVYAEPDNYEAIVARLYTGLSVTGQQGPSGAADITSLDEGFGNYLRQLWQVQELPTETSVIGWGDDGIRDLHEQTWTSDNQFVRAIYYRIFFQVSQANEFLRETTEEKLDSRGIREDFRPTVTSLRAEARFLRAISYWHAIDLFGDVIFYTEENSVGSEAPSERSRSEIFDFLVSEMAAIEGDLPLPADQEYGRASRAAVWMMQAKLFQNASVYAGTDRNSEAVTALEKILDNGSFELTEEYQHLFLADNNTSEEMIFTVPFDGINTQSFGGLVYLTHAPVGGSMDPANFGINGGWAGLRTTPQFVDLFPGGADLEEDERALFYTDGQTKEVNNIGEFTSGYGLPKYRNVTSTGVAGSDPRYADVDYPMFRLGDAYLMYAESVLRNGGGDRGRALDLVNDLRERAGADEISDEELTLDFILAERGRELYWEGHRRTDRIRFDAFSDNGIWAWKGGTQQGSTTESFRDLYPIPASELLSNPNLTQNDGY